MMEKRLLLAAALSLAVLAIWWWIFPPQPVQRPPAPAESAAPGGEAAVPAPPAATQDGRAAADQALRGGAGASGTGAGVAEPERPDLPEGRAVGAAAEETVVIDGPLFTIRLTNRGARVVSWRLKKYQDDEGKPLELVSAAGVKLDHLPLQLLLDDAEPSKRLKEALYRVERHETTEGDRPIVEVSMAFSDGAGLAATKTLRVDPASYLATLAVRAEAGGKPVTPTIIWGAGFGPHNGLEKGQYADQARVVVNVPGRGVEVHYQAKDKPGEPWTGSDAIAWAGVEDNYFAAVLVPPAPVLGRVSSDVVSLIEDGREHRFLTFGARLPGATLLRLYVGPKDHEVLASLGLGLERLLNWGFFGVVALPLFHAMKFIDRYTGNYGWSIIVLTILIRLIFFPFMYKGQVKMRKMQEKMKRVQPKIKAMRERYHRIERKEIEKGTPGARAKLRQQMNEEMMALYKEEDINPLGSMSGCLPILLQIPILYGFYKVLTIAIELRKAPFVLWIRDLSQKDPYYVTPVVMGITMLVQQVMTSSSMPDPAQRRIMYIMPVMFTFMFVQFPSGLVLYWLVSNLLGIAQQYLINKQAEAESKPA
jgi:YidC/Oxa1 family membrane protein insertase